MSIIIKITSISILLIALNACTHSPKEKRTDFVIDIQDNGELSELFTGYDYIPLETTENNLIGKIDKIMIDSISHKIYVMERERSSIYIFNKDGKFINSIEKQGRAPEEYLSLDDFVTYKSNIYCLSRFKKISVYSETGEFLRSYKLDDWYNNFTILNDSLMFLFSENSNNTNYNFILFDYKNDTYPQKFDAFKKNQSYLFRKSPFNPTKNGLFVTKEFDHTVYNLTKTSINPVYSFGFNTSDKIPANYLDMDTENLSKSLKDKSVVRRINHITQSGNKLWLVYEIFLPDLGYRWHITSTDLITKTIKTIRLGDKLDAEFPCMMNPSLFYADQLVTYTPAVAAINIAQRLSLDIFKNDSIQETDNPILFLYKLKP